MKSIVDILIEEAGSQVALARKIGIKQQSIGKWKAKRKIPAHRALKIEKIFKSKYSLHLICPDIYPRNS